MSNETKHPSNQCPICREIHEPRGLSFDGKGVNSCGMYRTRLATLTADGIQSGVGAAMAAAPDMLTTLKAIEAIAGGGQSTKAIVERIAILARAAIAKGK